MANESLLARTPSGSAQHLVLPTGEATYCGMAVDTMYVWPIHLNNRMAPAKTCSKCVKAHHAA